MGVGLADGRVVLHHLKFDEEVACFRNAAGAGLAAGAMLGGGAGKAGSTGGGGVPGEAVTALSFKNGEGEWATRERSMMGGITSKIMYVSVYTATLLTCTCLVRAWCSQAMPDRLRLPPEHAVWSKRILMGEACHSAVRQRTG